MTTGDDKRDLDLRKTPRRGHAVWWTLFAILAMLLVGAYAYGKLRSAITVPPKPAARAEDMPLSTDLRPKALPEIDGRKLPGFVSFGAWPKHDCWT